MGLSYIVIWKSWTEHLLQYSFFALPLHSELFEIRKAQKFKEVALSLNRYQQFSNFPLNSVIQTDTHFFLIRGKDNKLLGCGEELHGQRYSSRNLPVILFRRDSCN